jgi:hypothetical protein
LVVPADWGWGRSNKDSIGSFQIRIPFALIAAGMESLVTGFGSQAKKKRAAFLAWASTLYSFLFEDIDLIERENWVPRLKKYRRKGNNCSKTTLSDLAPKTME